MKHTILRDQIHGDIRLDPMSTALLDTPQMQRLGRVYQLGFAHLVFRGGNHTRLSHVIGAARMGELLVENLRLNYEKSNAIPSGAIQPMDFLPEPQGRSIDINTRWDTLSHIIKWGALLHDIAHVPLGHTLEDEYDNIYEKHDDFKSDRLEFIWTHEFNELESTLKNQSLYPEYDKAKLDPEKVYFTVALICLYKEKKRVNANNNTEVEQSFEDLLKAAIEDKKAQNKSTLFLKQILKSWQSDNNYFEPYMADIVSDTICADYLDYLNRDPYNVGLDVLRDKRVITKFFVGIDGYSHKRMALSLENEAGKPRLDTVSGVVDLVNQRYRFAEIIYYHKTKVSASAMLAKALTLLGIPQEVSEPSKNIELADIPSLADTLLANGKDLEHLKTQYYPNSIIDVPIGDDSLILWLREKAWVNIALSIDKKDQRLISRTLTGISLLQNITNRNLYKVGFSMDSELFKSILGETYSEDKLQDVIERLRDTESNEREELETAMCEAASLPYGSLILYVPPRKSQAKGIETGALEKDKVITLGDHPTVKSKVDELGQSYSKLWKMILLVYPGYREDHISLSKAVDYLADKVLNSQNSNHLSEGCWFHYIPKGLRDPANEYQKLMTELSQKPKWQDFIKINGDLMSTPQDLAYRFVVSHIGDVQIEAIQEAFPKPGSLENRVTNMLRTTTLQSFSNLRSDSSNIEQEPSEEIELTKKRLMALKKIVDETFPDGKLSL